MARTRALVGVVVVVSMLAGCSRDEGGGNGGVYRTLAVTISGAGAGTVTSSLPGISCSSGTCSASFAEGTVVALTATPSGGSTLESWAGACSGSGDCSVTMNADASVTATFRPPPVLRTLSVTIAGSGGGTVTSSPPGISCSSGTCAAELAEGTPVTLTATPAGDGSTFAGWAGACSGSGGCSVTMDADASVAATFQPPPVMRTLSVTIAGSGGGTVTSSPSGISCSTGTQTATFADGQVVILDAAPAGPGSAFVGWAGACSGETTARCTLTIDADTSVTATFTALRTVTVTLAGDPGTVTSEPPGIDCTTGSSGGCSATFANGTAVTLTATPPDGTTFAGWSAPCAGVLAPCTFDATTNVGVTATFSAWVAHRPFPTVLRGAAVLGSTLVAVGEGGAWVTSEDGFSWTGHELSSSAALRGVAAGSGTAVAVGDQGTILTTTDASTWTSRTSGTTASLAAVAYGGGTFVAVGKGGVVLASTDGTTWTAGASGTTRDLLAVAYGAGKFVATGYAGTILTSTDGQTWTARSSGTPEYLAGVAFGASGFVAVGSAGVVLTSADGQAWASRPSPTPGTLTAVTASSGTYVAVDDRRNVFVSTSGASWTQHLLYVYADPSLAVVAMGPDLYVLGSAGSIRRSSDGGASWTLVLFPSGFAVSTAYLHAAVFGGSRYVVVGSFGTILSSPDGAVWTSRHADDHGAFTSVAYGNGVFVAVSNTEILTSADGDTWTAVAAAPGPYTGAVAYGPGVGFVAMAVSADYGNTLVRTSPDGATWTPQPAIAGRALRSIAYGASRFVAVGPGGAISSHGDPASGTAWTQESSPTTDELGTVTFGNSTFVAVDRTTYGATFTSADGATWSSAHASTTPLHDILAFGDGVFRMSSLTSADGVSWAYVGAPTVPGEPSGNVTRVQAAAWGGPAGWVAAKGFWTGVAPGEGFAVLTHP